MPAALTIAASLPDVAADDLAAAIVAGYEAMIRLGAAIDGPSVLYRGIWPSYFAAPFGAAAVAARLLRLDDKQTANALSAALIMAAPGAGHHAAPTTMRWLAVGHAAGRGLQAALAAGAGFTSDVKIADGDFLKNIFGITPNAALLGGGSGGLALSQTSFKPWCAARQTMAATQALREILADGVDAAIDPAHRRRGAAAASEDDRSRRHRGRPLLAPDQRAISDGGGGARAGPGLWLERAVGADRAGAVGLHVAHPGPGRGGAARRRLSASLAGACHGHGVEAGASAR